MAQVAPETDCSPFIVDRYPQASGYAAWSGTIRQEPSPTGLQFMLSHPIRSASSMSIRQRVAAPRGRLGSRTRQM